jgi:hypothetical protein
VLEVLVLRVMVVLVLIQFLAQLLLQVVAVVVSTTPQVYLAVLVEALVVMVQIN